jgi:outer membrane protein TolC
MMERPAWPLLLIAAATLGSAAALAGPCAAQAPATATATATATEPTAPPPRPRPAAPLPSTVSPIIERFMSRKVQSLPQPPAQAAPAAAEAGRGAAPSPTPPPLAPTVAGPLQALAARDLPQAVPRTPTIPPPRAPGNDDASRMPPSPLATRVTLGRAPVEPNDLRFPINLATALRLSDARPLIVAAAQASVWSAEADLQQARVIWIPTLNFAADYIRHDGGGPDFNKGIMTAPSVNFFYGGAGLWGFIPSTDAIFQPLVARQVLNSRQWDVQSSKNDALLRTADAYFAVHQQRGIYVSTLYCVERGHQLVERLATLSQDMVQGFEVERARNMVADLEQRAVLARQRWRVSSADLTQVLRLDPRAVVEPLEHDHLQVTLIDPSRTLEDLVPAALSNRPEVASRRAMIQAATAGIRREKMRPILPSVVLTGFQSSGGMLIQAGLFGLGPNSSINQWTGREDVSIQLMWQLENFGFGNLARIKRQRGEQSQAIVDLFRAQDRVAADVTRALARVQMAAARILQADRALRAGIINLNGTYEGLKEISRFGNVLVLVNRPQEAVFSLQLLRVAFEEYFNTVAEYNRAQFELFHAMGYPAQELAVEHPPGEIQSVDLSRPKFLPPVGNGPPPATR